MKLGSVIAWSFVFAAGALAGCGAGGSVPDAEGEALATDTGKSGGASTIAAPEAGKKCGSKGYTVYALDCKTLKAQCKGKFTCADTIPSDKCATWGECTEKSAEDERERSVSSGEPTNEREEPVRSVACGRDGAHSYNRSCAELKLDCRAAGGDFVCHDAVASSSCNTWGTCSFAPPSDPAGSGPVPKELDASTMGPEPFEDISTFECSEKKGDKKEDKVCCLWIPGKGNTSVDCGGWLDTCTALGGKGSGGAHAASCTF